MTRRLRLETIASEVEAAKRRAAVRQRRDRAEDRSERRWNCAVVRLRPGLVPGCWVELDGVTVARLLPDVRLSLLDRLTEAFRSIGEDIAAYVALFEDRIDELASR